MCTWTFHRVPDMFPKDFSIQHPLRLNWHPFGRCWYEYISLLYINTYLGCILVPPTAWHFIRNSIPKKLKYWRSTYAKKSQKIQSKQRSFAFQEKKLPETNSSYLKKWHTPKTKTPSSNHHYSGALAVSFGEGTCPWDPWDWYIYLHLPSNWSKM